MVPSYPEGLTEVFEDEMLTIEDLAAYLKLKPQTIYRWAQTGKIPGAKFGKEWRFRRSAIERWIDERMSSSDGEAVETGDGLPAARGARGAKAHRDGAGNSTGAPADGQAPGEKTTARKSARTRKAGMAPEAN